MRKGTITNVSTCEGIGYIVDENEEEIAFCLGDLVEGLTTGQLVGFEIVLCSHGLVARNVQLLVS